MNVALVFSSKSGMEAAWARLFGGSGSASCPADWLAEFDSKETIEALGHVLEERHEVFYLESDEFVFEGLRNLRPDLVFNIAEGLCGASRESQIPAVCEMLNLPYTGSDPLTLGICLDKSRAKEILSFHGISTPVFAVAQSQAEIPDRFPLPAIVKPLFEGSSMGISDDAVVRDRRALSARVETVISRYRQPALIEKFLGGREFTVGGIGNIPDPEIFPFIEMKYDGLPAGANPIYSYEAKWIWDRPAHPLEIFECPASCTEILRRRIEDVVRRAWRALRIRDWCRMDIRLDEFDEPHIIEINPLPGILPDPLDNSSLPKAARAAGICYSRLIHRVVETAVERTGIPGRDLCLSRRIGR